MKKCNVKLGENIDKQLDKTEVAPKQNFEKDIANSFDEKLTKNNTYEKAEESKMFFRLKDMVKTIQEKFSIKLNLLNKPFDSIKDGKDKIVRFTTLRAKLTSLEGNYNRTGDVAENLLKEDFNVQTYDENGIAIEGKYEQLEASKINTLGNYMMTKNIIAMYDEDKKVYFKNDFIDMLKHPENYGNQIEDSQDYRDSINDDVELKIEQMTEKRIAARVKQEILKYTTEKGIKSSDISDEVNYAIEIEVRDNFMLSEKQKNLIAKEARNFAEDRNYVDFLKNEMLPVYEAMVTSDPQTNEVYQNGLETDEQIRIELMESYKKIGKNPKYLFKRTDDYMKAIIKNVMETKKGEAPTALGVNLSSFVGQKGSYNEVFTNIKMSRYVFIVAMKKNIYHAEIVSEIDKFNVVPDLINEINNELDYVSNDFEERLLDKTKSITQNEEKRIINSIYAFNKNTASKYADLTINKEDIRSERTFRDKEGNIKIGSIYTEIKNNLDIALENEINHLKSLYLEGEFDSFFDEKINFEDVKSYLDGHLDQIARKRMIDFSEELNNDPTIRVNKLNTIHISEITKIKNELDATLLKNGRVKLNKLFKNYLYDVDGNERYVLTDQNGNMITNDQQMSLGSLYFEDFDKSNPDAFAEFMAEKFFVNEDINNTTDFLKNNKIKILPKPLAQALDDVKIKMSPRQENIFVKELRKITTYSKIGLLHSPFQILGFTSRNTISDTIYMMQSQPQALKELGLHGDVWSDMADYFKGDVTSSNFQAFLKYSETHYGVIYDDIFKDLSMEGKTSLEKLSTDIKNYQIEAKNKGTNKGLSSLVSGFKVMNYGLKKYFTAVSHFSETRELILRYAVFNSKFKEFNKSFEEKGVYSTNNYGASKRKMIETIINDANEATDLETKNDLITLAAIEFANQSLVAYKDSSPGVDSLSRYLVPFLRFTEGNIRLHYRLMENFVYDMADSIKTKDFKKGSRTVAKGAYNSGLALGLPMMFWNAAMLALQGMDAEDIPEYYAENGYTVMPPLLKMFGYDQSLILSNTDVFSEMMSIVALDDLNTNILNALKKNFSALSDEDLDTDLFNDLADAFIESFDNPLDVAKAIWDKGISMANPMLKSVPELLGGKDYYPEGPVSVGYKYTVNENIVRKLMSSVGFARLYTLGEEWWGTPRGMDAFETFGFKSIGTKQDAWTQQRSLAYSYSENVLEKDPYKGEDGYGDEIDYMRDDIYNQIKYGNYQEAQEAIINYVMYLEDHTENNEELQKAVDSLTASMKNRFDVIPSSAIPQSEMQTYIESLSESQINDLILAYEYQRDILGPYYEWLYGNE